MNFINRTFGPTRRLVSWLLCLSFLQATGPQMLLAQDNPPGVLDIEEMVEGFRAVFRRKMEELSESFIVRHSGDQKNGAFRFQSNQPAKCYGPPIQNQDEVSKIIYRQEIKKLENGVERLHDNVQYWGCNRNVEMIEQVTILGKNLELRNLTQIRKAARSFALSDDIQEIHWRMLNQDQEEITSVRILHAPKQETRIYFQVAGALLATLNFIYKESEKRFIFDFPNLNFTYKRKYSKWRYNSTSNQPNTYEARQTPNNPANYLNARREFISQQDFQQAMTDKLIGQHSRLKIIEQIFKYHLYGFPQTAISVNLGNNQRVLNELRLANIRLLSSTDLNLVQNLIQSYIESIEKGEIKIDDLRGDQ